MTMHTQPSRQQISISQPSRQQRRIINSPAQYKAVSAGPGTGKTTLQLAIAKTLLSQNGHRDILMLTFSKKAAQDVRQKVQNPRIHVHTLHAFGYQLIREFHQRLGYRQPPAFVDTAQAQAALKRQFKRHFAHERIDKQQKNALEKLLWRVVQHEADVKKYITQQHPELLPWADKLIDLKKKFQKSQRKKVRVTFGDQVTVARKLLREHPGVLRIIGRRYQAVLVDEFQDLSAAQLDIVRALATMIGQAVVVGDEAQSIYGFRGACGDGLQQFCRWFQNAQHFSLSHSYRCSEPIIQLANAIRNTVPGVDHTPLISKQSNTHAKPQHVKFDGAEWQDRGVIAVINRLRSKYQLNYSDIAILARRNLSLFEMHRALCNAGHPVLLGNKAILEQLCKQTQHLLMVINGDERGIDSLLESLGIPVNTETRNAVRTLKKNQSYPEVNYLIERLKQAKGDRDWEHQLNVSQKCLAHYHAKDTKKFIRPHFNRFKKLARPCITLEAVSEGIQAYRDSQEQGVALQTLHAVKGLEYAAVIIIDVVDGYFPDPRSLNHDTKLDDERKLLYVGVTRAKRHLYLFSRTYLAHDKHASSRTKTMTQCSLMNEAILSCLRQHDYSDY
jgi:DNA helicase-2/ATP-dependent DNA helicase PcrA